MSAFIQSGRSIVVNISNLTGRFRPEAAIAESGYTRWPLFKQRGGARPVETRLD